MPRRTAATSTDRYGTTSPEVGGVTWGGGAAGDPIINDYDEDSQPAEKFFVVVSGRAVFDLDGEQVEVTPGALVYVEPGMRRTAVAAEPVTTILVFEGAPGKVYDARVGAVGAPRTSHAGVSTREPHRAAAPAIVANPQYPMLVYNLACSESLSGRTTDGIDHLRLRSASEKYRTDARTDSDLDPIRDEPSFKGLIGERIE